MICNLGNSDMHAEYSAHNFSRDTTLRPSLPATHPPPIPPPSTFYSMLEEERVNPLQEIICECLILGLNQLHVRLEGET